jgi:hypothetical protein
MLLWYCWDIVIWVWDIVNMSLRYYDIVEILWYEFENYIGFENYTCFEFNFFWICTKPICVGWIKSPDTNNLILVSVYLTQPISIMIIDIGWQSSIQKNVWFFISYRWYRLAWPIPITAVNIQDPFSSNILLENVAKIIVHIYAYIWL